MPKPHENTGEFATLLKSIEEYAVAYDGYPIPEAKTALKKARLDLVKFIKENERKSAYKAWNEGFDEASDDLGRAETMESFGESTNPYRRNDEQEH